MKIFSNESAVFNVLFYKLKGQSSTGYNYPSPFNPLTPGAPSDLGGSPGASVQPQQSTPYAGSQPGYNNQPFSPPGKIWKINSICQEKMSLSAHVKNRGKRCE